MWRSWRLQTITSTPVPVFGDKLTAAFNVPQNSGIDPIMTVADTTLYQQGDRITIEPGTANADTVLVVNILSSTTMQVSGQGATLHNHASNSVLQLAVSCAEITIQANPPNTNTIYIGPDNTITNAGGGDIIAAITPGLQPWRSAYDAGWDKLMTKDLWMVGTSPDKVIAAFETI